MKTTIQRYSITKQIRTKFFAAIAGVLLSSQANAAFLFWIDDGNDAIWRADENGNNAQMVLQQRYGSLRGIASDNKHLYWTDTAGGGFVRRSNFDGSGVTTLVLNGVNDPQHIYVYNQNIFVADQAGGGIIRFDLNGGNRTALDVRRSILQGIHVANDMIYWTDNGLDNLSRSALDGGSQTELIDFDADNLGRSNPRGIFVKGGHIYWTDTDRNQIVRANLDGSSATQLVGGVGHATDVSVSDNHVYWIDSSGNKIQRSDLNGGNVTDIITSNIDSPVGLILVTVPEPSGVLLGCFGAGVVLLRRKREA